jgi:hypothetical protein
MTAGRNGAASAGVDRAMAANLLPLDEATGRLRPYARRYLRALPVRDVEMLPAAEIVTQVRTRFGRSGAGMARKSG